MSHEKAVKLKGVRFKEGSFVAEGANQAADIMLYKAKDKYESDVDGEDEKDLAKTSGEQPTNASLETVDKINGGGSMPETKDIVDAVAKSETVELQKAVVDLKKHADELRVELNKEREARLDRELLDKAATYNVPGMSQVELKDLLKAVDGNADAQDKIDKMLKVVTQLHKQGSALTKSLGNAGASSSGDAWDEVQNLAKAKVKADPKLDLNTAIGQVALGNPELYERYQWERAAKMRQL